MYIQLLSYFYLLIEIQLKLLHILFFYKITLESCLSKTNKHYSYTFKTKVMLYFPILRKLLKKMSFEN